MFFILQVRQINLQYHMDDDTFIELVPSALLNGLKFDILTGEEIVSVNFFRPSLNFFLFPFSVLSQ